MKFYSNIDTNASTTSVLYKLQQTQSFSQHNPKSPRIFEKPDNHKRRYPIIEKAKRNLVESYFNPLRYDVGRLFYRPEKRTKLGAYRKRRSESRESITCRVGQILLHYINLETMIFGHYDSGTYSYIYYDMNFIAAKSGLTYRQVQRTLKIFEKVNYITIEERKKKQPDGTIKSLNAIIRATPQLYYDLGVTEEELNEYRLKKARGQLNDTLKLKAKQNFYEERQLKKEYKAFKKKEWNKERNIDEFPGSDRKREEAPLYRDYTGISQNRQEVLAKNGGLQKTETAAYHLSAILKKLKPPT